MGHSRLLNETERLIQDQAMRRYHAIMSNAPIYILPALPLNYRVVSEQFHACYSVFFVKKVDNLDIPLTLAFFSFSTPCDPLLSFFRFLAPSAVVAGPVFDFLVLALLSASNDCSFASALTCVSSLVQLTLAFSITRGKCGQVRTRTRREASPGYLVEGIDPITRMLTWFFPLYIVGRCPFIRTNTTHVQAIPRFCPP